MVRREFADAKKRLSEDVKIAASKASRMDMHDDVMLAAFADALIEKKYSSNPVFGVKASSNDRMLLIDTSTDSEWLIIYDYDAVEDQAVANLMSRINDIGIVDYMGDEIFNYMDSHRFDDDMEKDIKARIAAMDRDRLVDEMEWRGILTSDDAVPNPDWKPNPEDPGDDEGATMFTDETIDLYKDDLFQLMKGDYSDSIEWFIGVYGDDGLDDYIERHPECVDVDVYIEDMIDLNDPYMYISEDYFDFDVLFDGDDYTYYAFKIN